MAKGRVKISDELSQLLMVLEGHSEIERQQVLSLIERDDPAKAALLKARLLTVDRIFMLDEESLSRVLEDVPANIVSNSLRGIDLELRQRVLRLINGSKRNQILDLMKRTKPDEQEIQSAQRQLVARVRELEIRGSVHLGSLRLAEKQKQAA